jgi:hypothetical protein
MMTPRILDIFGASRLLRRYGATAFANPIGSRIAFYSMAWPIRRIRLINVALGETSRWLLRYRACMVF